MIPELFIGLVIFFALILFTLGLMAARQRRMSLLKWLFTFQESFLFWIMFAVGVALYLLALYNQQNMEEWFQGH